MAVEEEKKIFRQRTYFNAFLLCLLAIPGYASQNPSADQWRQLTQDKAFSYKNDIESIQPVKQYDPGLFQKVIAAILGFFGSGAGNILLWIIVTCAVVYVVYKLFLSKDSFVFGRSKKILSEPKSIEEEEEDLATTNWEGLMQQAADRNDIRLTVRYSYKWLLQLLQQRDLIQYRNDKTNYEYYTELSETDYKQPFKALSRQYEYAWYGHFNLSAAAYNDYLSQFHHLRKELGA